MDTLTLIIILQVLILLLLMLLWRQRAAGSGAKELQEQLETLRHVAGADAVGYPQDMGAYWLCLCGRPNPASQDVCVRCERDRRTQFTQYGKASIEAALNPADGDMIYWVVVNPETGETKFAATLADHQANVKVFQAWCAANKGKC